MLSVSAHWGIFWDLSTYGLMVWCAMWMICPLICIFWPWNSALDFIIWQHSIVWNWNYPPFSLLDKYCKYFISHCMEMLVWYACLQKETFVISYMLCTFICILLLIFSSEWVTVTTPLHSCWIWATYKWMRAFGLQISSYH